jgi:hypothetical protein
MRKISEKQLNVSGSSRQPKGKIKPVKSRGPQAAAVSTAAAPNDTPSIDPQTPYTSQYENLDEPKETKNENEAANARFSELKEEYMAKRTPQENHYYRRDQLLKSRETRSSSAEKGRAQGTRCSFCRVLFSEFSREHRDCW